MSKAMIANGSGMIDFSELATGPAGTGFAELPSFFFFFLSFLSVVDSFRLSSFFSTSTSSYFLESFASAA